MSNRRGLLFASRSQNDDIFTSDKGPPPPGVVVAARRILEDGNDEPQYGDRVPYVIVRGDPHSRLVERAITPEEFLANRCVPIPSSASEADMAQPGNCASTRPITSRGF